MNDEEISVEELLKKTREVLTSVLDIMNPSEVKIPPINLGPFESFIVERKEGPLGTHVLFRFPNWYGASLVFRSGSYGWERNLWELGVIIWDSPNHFQLTYDTPLTDDVLGYLDNNRVLDVLGHIKSL